MAAGQESLIQQIPLSGGRRGGEDDFLADIPRIIHIAAGVLLFHDGIPRDCYYTLLYDEVMASANVPGSYR